MNPKVEQLLRELKSEQRHKQEQARDKHLRKLGLISKELDDNCNYKTLSVTDDEYVEICKYNPHTDNASTLEKDVATIKRIMVFFTWLWGVGIILWVIILLTSL